MLKTITDEWESVQSAQRSTTLTQIQKDKKSEEFWLKNSGYITFDIICSNISYRSCYEHNNCKVLNIVGELTENYSEQNGLINKVTTKTIYSADVSFVCGRVYPEIESLNVGDVCKVKAKFTYIRRDEGVSFAKRTRFWDGRAIVDSNYINYNFIFLIAEPAN